MIKTIRPYGAIAESQVQYLALRKGKTYIVDNAANRYEISPREFDELKTRFTVKEV